MTISSSFYRFFVMRTFQCSWSSASVGRSSSRERESSSQQPCKATACNCSRRSNTFFWPPLEPTLTNTYTHKHTQRSKRIYKNKKELKLSSAGTLFFNHTNKQHIIIVSRRSTMQKTVQMHPSCWINLPHLLSF